MNLGEFWYSRIRKREYPLIVIPKKPSFDVPYASTCPSRISLCFSEENLKKFNITEDNVDVTIEGILEHEYIHIVLWKLHLNRSSAKLNNINGWSNKYKKPLWRFKKDGKLIWETIDGDIH